VNVTLGGREFVVPPLNLKALRKLAPKIQMLAAIGDVPTDEQLEAVASVVHSALVRNYPDMTQEEVEDALDLLNLVPTIDAVMQASGLRRVAPGEAQEPVTSTGRASTGS